MRKNEFRVWDDPNTYTTSSDTFNTVLFKSDVLETISSILNKVKTNNEE